MDRRELGRQEDETGMSRLREGMTVMCPLSEGVYLLLKDLDERGWLCLVIVADTNYSEMETVGSTVIISRSWIDCTAVPVIP